MGVHAERDRLDAADAGAKIFDQRRHLGGQRVPDGVGHVDGRRAGGDRGGEGLRQKRAIGARGVLGRELDVGAAILRVAHAFGVSSSARARVIRSLRCRWRSEVAKKTWMRGRAARLTDWAAASMSVETHEPAPRREHLAGGACDLRDAAGDQRRCRRKTRLDRVDASAPSSKRAMRRRAAGVIAAPGDCSPSRRVVSNSSIVLTSAYPEPQLFLLGASQA